ncbi:MAG: GIY-YIG nuclease family protein [Elusimicrobiota bacterium]
MQFSNLPDKTGVYLFMDNAYQVVYVGKAKSLQKRVRQHFGGKYLDSRHISMISQVRSVDYIITENENEALLLENKLIKNVKPRYNIALKDDKSYPYLEITTSQKFPVLRISRNRRKGNKYFGPFPKVKDIRAAKKVIGRIFPLRKCKNFRKRKRPCLNYQIGKCLSPCTDRIAEEEYSKIVERITLFLKGKRKKLIDKLKKRMHRFKKDKAYENAARVRDQIEKLENIFPVVNFREVTQKKVQALNKIDPLYSLKDYLDMEFKPEVIEAFDISHTSSKEAVGAMVYFKNGQPDKSNYRRFKIKQGETADDLKMLREVVYRRLRRLTEENRKLPDIILIDGGKTQLKAVSKIAQKFKIGNLRIISLAKGKGNIFYNGKKLDINSESPVYRLIKRIDDEVHRFAIAYHRYRRREKFKN